MKLFKFKKKNKDVVKSFIDKWKEFDIQRHEAQVDMSFALENIIKNDSLRRLVVQELVKDGFRKVEDGGLVLSKQEVTKYVELEMLSIESLESYVNNSKITAKLELMKWIVKLFEHNKELLPFEHQFYELFQSDLKDFEKLTETQRDSLKKVYSVVFEEINFNLTER